MENFLYVYDARVARHAVLLLHVAFKCKGISFRKTARKYISATDSNVTLNLSMSKVRPIWLSDSYSTTVNNYGNKAESFSGRT